VRFSKIFFVSSDRHHHLSHSQAPRHIITMSLIKALMMNGNEKAQKMLPVGTFG
jgi:hypothetical protein